jgi:hypothetical protein
MNILFLHGWQSIPSQRQADIPGAARPRGHQSELPEEDFAEAVRIAQAEYGQHRPDVIVGSSRGGAVAMNLDSGTTPLVLLCPAWKRFGMARKVNLKTTILLSRADDVVPFADSEELVRNSGGLRRRSLRSATITGLLTRNHVLAVRA